MKKTVQTIMMLILIASSALSSFSASSAEKLTPLKMDVGLHAQLPEHIKASKTLNLVTDAHYPPCESFADDNKTMVGFEPDLWNALGKVLGVKVKPVSIDFSGLIPGVKSGRYDLAVECISDSLEREKQVTFVNYAYATSEVYTLANEASIKADPLTLCGKKVGVQTGTDFEAAIRNIYIPECTKNSRTPIKVVVLPSADAVLLALYSGRVDFVLNDAASVDEIKKKAPKPIRTITMPLMPKYYLGFVVAHENQQLADVLLKALQVLHKTGHYTAIMDKWGLAPMVLPKPGINLTSTHPL